MSPLARSQPPNTPPLHRPRRPQRRSIAISATSLLLSALLASCAGTGWGNAIGRALGSGNETELGATPTAPPATPSPTPATDRPTPDPNPTEVPNPTPTAPSPSNPGTAGELVLSLEPGVDRQPLDLDTAPQPLRPMIQDVAALGTLTLTPADLPQPSGQALTLANPVTRRQFVRWLVTTNNLLYTNRPAQQIRLASPGETPTFQDLPSTDPDFAVIQGLANAGVIASPLRGEATAVQFQPDAPLTRETLLQWKVPLDLRQGLPTATIDRIQQTWGFQDATRINATALGAVLADFQNGDLSNIRRLLGYTTLLQPQKPVTRGEAIAALWYFGFQGQGISAAEALRTPAIAAEPSPDAPPSPSPIAPTPTPTATP